MRDDAAFLSSIRAAPHDGTTRLVYADWLEERGDPRGELVRVEEEMRKLPVFSDEFWQLKRRRNELRASAATDWLGALGYGTSAVGPRKSGRLKLSWGGHCRLHSANGWPSPTTSVRQPTALFATSTR
jgi:uncharacterized protein (TIGR02996 family)